MKKKKPDMLTILLYAIIVFAVLYVSAGLGAAMDLSVDDEGVLDFNVLMTQFETVLTSTDTVGAHFTDFSSYSFKITLMVGFALGIYALMKYTSRKRLHRKGVEHGSARWANEKEEKFLADRMSARSKPKRGKDAAQQSLRTATKPEKKKGKNSPKSPFETDNNILLTQEVRMSLNTRQHRENLNVLVIGGSGSGKSRFYVKPNIMQLNTSYVVTDPKGELLRSCGRLLKKAGYEIRVFILNADRAADERQSSAICHKHRSGFGIRYKGYIAHIVRDVLSYRFLHENAAFSVGDMGKRHDAVSENGRCKGLRG